MFTKNTGNTYEPFVIAKTFEIEYSSLCETELQYNYTGKGIVCDVSNNMLLVDSASANNIDAENVANRSTAYFSNTDTYELDLRGDPAVDVGDYVYFENCGELQKALVLESELIFDGSFKDNMKIRVIENDFEEIKGNTHKDLSNYTHEQLSAYSHAGLESEVI